MTKTLIKKILREGLFDNIPEQDFINAYTNKINGLYNNLIDKGKKHKNFEFILGPKVNKNICGVKNKCETNTWSFIKERLEEENTNYYPVGGFGFEGQNLFPVEHWWVYDSTENKHIEITPTEGENFRCYAGIINFDINEDIKNSKNFYDIDFFKGGNIYSKYFK